MNVVTAFAAVGLTAVSWDDTLSRAGARAFRHALDYREPYCRMSENEVVLLMDAVLAMRLERGSKALMLEAAKPPRCSRPIKRSRPTPWPQN